MPREEFEAREWPSDGVFAGLGGCRVAIVLPDRGALHHAPCSGAEVCSLVVNEREAVDALPGLFGSVPSWGVRAVGDDAAAGVSVHPLDETRGDAPVAPTLDCCFGAEVHAEHAGAAPGTLSGQAGDGIELIE